MRKTSSTAQPRQGRGLTVTSMRTTALGSTEWAARLIRARRAAPVERRRRLCAALSVRKPPPQKKVDFGWPKCVLLRAKRGRPALLVLPGRFRRAWLRAQGELQPKAGGRVYDKAVRLTGLPFCSISTVPAVLRRASTLVDT
jgi:hypothetical protein